MERRDSSQYICIVISMQKKYHFVHLRNSGRVKVDNI